MIICEYLRSRHIPFETLLHCPTPSASRFAHSVHVSGKRVAKAVLLSTDRGYVLAVLPATHRVDLARVAQIIGVEGVTVASEDDLERVFNDCERGALPPFGKLYGLTTVLDSSLAAEAEIVIEGNVRHEGFRLNFRDYEALEAPLFASFASTSPPSRPQTPPRRRAG